MAGTAASRRKYTMPGAAIALLALLTLALRLWRVGDQRAVEAAWSRLLATAPGTVERFDPAMVEDLPEAARRYFQYTIAPGTPLMPVSEIRMVGEIGLGDRDAPGYQPMRARQLLAPPDGLIWIVEEAGSGVMRMSGSDGVVDGRSWTRFWLLGSLPVVRAGDDSNHLRSSFGRLVAEAAFWAPAALLPGENVRWEAGDSPDIARATVTYGALGQSLEIKVAEDGRPVRVTIPRWSNENPEGEWRIQPFGGTLEEFRTFDGFTLPTRVDGGNHFGTDDFFPFYRAIVVDITFPQ
jgi:hypothetical protein